MYCFQIVKNKKGFCSSGDFITSFFLFFPTDKEHSRSFTLIPQMRRKKFFEGKNYFEAKWLDLTVQLTFNCYKWRHEDQNDVGRIRTSHERRRTLATQNDVISKGRVRHSRHTNFMRKNRTRLNSRICWNSKRCQTSWRCCCRPSVVNVK